MSDSGATATPIAEELSRAAIARVDASDQLGDVLALPEHLRDAVWRVESAIMQDWDTSAGLVVAGMGGSAIGGALAREQQTPGAQPLLRRFVQPLLHHANHLQSTQWKCNA